MKTKKERLRTFLCLEDLVSALDTALEGRDELLDDLYDVVIDLIRLTPSVRPRITVQIEEFAELFRNLPQDVRNVRRTGEELLQSLRHFW